MTPWRRLLHRWFVEYNPLYLLSALLVLGGTMAMARGLAATGVPHGELAVAGIVEAYAIALVGGATLLHRIGQRRPAVVLALLATVYQGDLMLHTETCPSLGIAGAVAAVTWLGLFAAKLVALVRAVRVRPDRAAWAALLLGAAGLAGIPWLLHGVEPRLRDGLAFVWVQAVAELGLRARLRAAAPLDATGEVVLRRSAGALGAALAALLLLHVLFWGMHSTLAVGPLLLVVPLVALRRIEGPGTVAIVALGALLFVSRVAPDSLAPVALGASIALALRARASVRRVAVGEAPVAGPYRQDPAGASAAEIRYALEPDPVAAARLGVLAAACLWLAAWTAGWHGGELPAHLVLLDVGFTVAGIAFGLRRRAVAPAGPVALGWGHRLATTVRVPLPTTPLGWGTAAVALGFVLLLGSLVTSYRLRDEERPT